MASSYASLGNPENAPNLRWMYLPRPEAAAPALRHPDWVLQHGAKPSLNSSLMIVLSSSWSSSPPLSYDSYYFCLLHVHNLHAQNLLYHVFSTSYNIIVFMIMVINYYFIAFIIVSIIILISCERFLPPGWSCLLCLRCITGADPCHVWTKRWVFPQVFSKARCSKMVGWNLLNIMISTNRKV